MMRERLRRTESRLKFRKGLINLGQICLPVRFSSRPFFLRSIASLSTSAEPPVNFTCFKFFYLFENSKVKDASTKEFFFLILSSQWLSSVRLKLMKFFLNFFFGTKIFFALQKFLKYLTDLLFFSSKTPRIPQICSSSLIPVIFFIKQN